jgi:hypothetical protein
LSLVISDKCLFSSFSVLVPLRSMKAVAFMLHKHSLGPSD